MNEKRILLISSIILVAILSIFVKKEKSVSTIVINEISSRNMLCNADYIELYNSSNEEISLNGWYLSDDTENLDLQKLPDVSLSAGEYYLLYADGIGEKEDTLNFKINQDGESIILTNSEGKIVDQIYVPKLELNSSYSRENDGSSIWKILEASPGKSNNGVEEAAKLTLETPKLSHVSGFYQEEFVLEIDANPGEKIYYTTDGSLPTKNSLLYSEGILVKNNTEQKNVINGVQNLVADWKDYSVLDGTADKGNIIKAIAMDDNNNISEVITAVYFVDMDKYEDCNIISISANPEEMIGEEGIFVTGNKYDEWYLSSEMSKDGEFERGWTENYELTNFWLCDREDEVYGNVQIFEKGKELLNQMAGIRVQGCYSRTNAKKNLQLFARNVYSENYVFEKPVFDNINSHAIYVSAIPSKAYFLELAKERNLDIQQTKPCEVFINGEHWYSGVMMEKYDATYFSEHYGINENNILCVKDDKVTVGEDNAYLYEELVEFLKNETISQEEKTERLYQDFNIQSFIDWMCFQLYIGNDDVSYKRNLGIWRTIYPDGSSWGDCKWRFMVYDIDHATFMDAKNTDFNSFMLMKSNRFYWALKSDEEFCKQFVLTAMDMMNSIFLPDNVKRSLDKWEIDLSYANNYFIERPEYMKQALVNEFGLSGKKGQITVNTNIAEAGTITVNSLTISLENGSWSGEYFTDYPIAVTANTNSGYRFVGWSGDYESDMKSIGAEVTETGIILNAIFEKE